MARLINYNAKRNKPATGLLKVDAMSTTQDVNDSTGTNLANTNIIWNDSANSNYREQFTSILNAANQTGQLFGKPRESGTIGGITTEVYTLSSNQLDLPIFTFSKSIGGITRAFEIVPSTIDDSDSIYESSPVPGTGLTYSYRSDGSGDSSNNTGFFFLFKQGTMQQQTFSVNTAVTNFIQSLEVANINDTDVWLYKLAFVPVLFGVRYVIIPVGSTDVPPLPNAIELMKPCPALATLSAKAILIFS